MVRRRDSNTLSTNKIAPISFEVGAFCCLVFLVGEDGRGPEPQIILREFAELAGNTAIYSFP
jgi:hypothetical protein